MSFADDLQAHMTKTGQSQTELSEVFEVTQPTVSRWVRGLQIPSRDLLRLVGAELKASNATIVDWISESSVSEKLRNPSADMESRMAAIEQEVASLRQLIEEAIQARNG